MKDIKRYIYPIAYKKITEGKIRAAAGVILGYAKSDREQSDPEQLEKRV